MADRAAARAAARARYLEVTRLIEEVTDVVGWDTDDPATVAGLASLHREAEALRAEVFSGRSPPS